MLASDAANPHFVGAHNPDAALVVRFYGRAVHQPFETAKQGRPIFVDVDYIMIHTPGNQLNIVDTPVTNEHRRRFAQQWAHYQSGKGSGVEFGTPVNQWPFLSAAQAEEFRALKFFTVEQLANASDLQLQSIGMVGGANPHAIRSRAQAYLQAAAGNAPTEKLAQDNADLRSMLADMQKQMAALAAAQGVAVPERKPKKEKSGGMSAEARAAAGARMRKMHADKAAAKEETKGQINTSSLMAGQVVMRGS